MSAEPPHSSPTRSAAIIASTGPRALLIPPHVFMNPWNMLPPDRVWDQSQNRVYYNTVSVGAQLTCGGGMTFTAPVKNNTNHAVSGIMLEVLRDGQVKGTSQALAIAAGASKTASVTIYFQGDPGSYKTRLVDPQNTANGAITGSGASYDVERTCDLTIDPVL